MNLIKAVILAAIETALNWIAVKLYRLSETLLRVSNAISDAADHVKGVA